MMKNKQILATVLTVALIIGGAALSALAFQSYLTDFNTQYPAATGTRIDSCVLCHPSGTGGPTNPYGTDFAANAHVFDATLEALDSDGDGPTNIEEITALTFPGDPNDPVVTTTTITPTAGTIGTVITLGGSGFGTKKGKVGLGDIFTKIGKDDWTDITVTATIKKALVPDVYDVTIFPKETASIVLTNAFTVTAPVLDPLLVNHGSEGTPITVTGLYFGTKGKVYIFDPASGKKKKCKIDKNDPYFMDPATGESRFTFFVPKLPKKLPPGLYQLLVSNKVGEAVTPFTVDP